MYNAFNVYCRELAPGTVTLTGDRAQGDDSKHCANSTVCILENVKFKWKIKHVFLLKSVQNINKFM